MWQPGTSVLYRRPVLGYGIEYLFRSVAEGPLSGEGFPVSEAFVGSRAIVRQAPGFPLERY
jgi:hypothetical protein